MSDDATDAEAQSAPKDTGSDPTRATPRPRPRTAASRARRIGGVASGTARTGAGDAAAPTVAEPTGTAGTDDDEAGPSTGRTKRRRRAAADASGVDLAKDSGTRRGKAEPDEGSDGARRGAVALPGWTVWAPTVAFGAAALVFLALFLFRFVGGEDTPDTTSKTERDRVLAAAKTCVAALNTYRYTDLDGAEAAGVKCTTGQMTKDYRSAVTRLIRPNATKLKAVQLAKITTGGIETVTKSGRQFGVLLYGQLSITTTNTGGKGRVDTFAVVATMQQVGDKWLIAKIDPVSSS